ncbi:MAG: hypothetical protein ACXACP_03615 [Candidatus Hodarchaeales archaeon]|jgi:hypothetical protein
MTVNIYVLINGHDNITITMKPAAWRLYKRRQIPHPYKLLLAGTLLVYPDRQKLPPKVAIYVQ